MRRSAARSRAQDIIAAIESQVRKASLVPVVSDFLFAEPRVLIAELSHLNAVHDIFLLMADVRFAYEVPRGLGRMGRGVRRRKRPDARVVAPRAAAAGRAHREWQDEIERLARDADLDVVRVGLDRWEMETALVKFTAERRLRKM